MKEETFRRRLADGTAWTTGWTPDEVDEDIDFEERVNRIAEQRSGISRHEAEQEAFGEMSPEEQDTEAERRAGCMNPDWLGDPTPEALQETLRGRDAENTREA
jgi:hypothetical protein